ncbi:MAG: hypothetical protein LVQ96_01325 [Thermoplasmatales archaeon]|nr:hypothetical protein [Thermoplasmatales archaeon]MCW6169795.1 hypothetical protein [Thermoplasmatales archaeon]
MPKCFVLKKKALNNASETSFKKMARKYANAAIPNTRTILLPLPRLPIIANKEMMPTNRDIAGERK